MRFQLDLPPRYQGFSDVHVDLGSGVTPRNPFGASRLIATDFESIGLTLKNGFEFVGCDLTATLPFDSSSISSCSAYDVLEHIPRWERTDSGITFPFVNLMQEIYRVLEPGGQFLAVTPAYPSPAAFQDPTHINIITRETLAYFAKPNCHARELGYGFEGEFEVMYENWLKGAGPYSQQNLFNVKRFTSRDGIVAYLKIMNRFVKYLLNRKPTHVIWVLKKI